MKRDGTKILAVSGLQVDFGPVAVSPTSLVEVHDALVGSLAVVVVPR